MGHKDGCKSSRFARQHAKNNKHSTFVNGLGGTTELYDQPLDRILPRNSATTLTPQLMQSPDDSTSTFLSVLQWANRMIEHGRQNQLRDRATSVAPSGSASAALAANTVMHVSRLSDAMTDAELKAWIPTTLDSKTPNIRKLHTQPKQQQLQINSFGKPATPADFSAEKITGKKCPMSDCDIDSRNPILKLNCCPKLICARCLEKWHRTKLECPFCRRSHAKIVVSS